jgi:Uma2 family endonuclease
MRAVMVNVPEALLAERRRTGVDRWDEVWEGVLHMVPPPSAAHQRLSAELLAVLVPLAKGRGLVGLVEAGLYRGDEDYRIPDQMYAQPDQLSDRGVEGGAPLVVEILSPGDESYDKLDWYAAGGVEEVLVIDPETRAAELFARRGGRMVLVESSPLRVAALGVELMVMDGPRLRLSWPGGSAEV